MNAWDDVPPLSGRHVTLRPLSLDDRDAILAAASDGNLWDLFYTGVPGPDTIDRWLEMAMREKSYGRAFPFAVLDSEGKTVGSTRYCRMNRQHRRVEIGYTFYSKSVQRTGLNTEAKRLLLEYAFGIMGCVCVQLRTSWFNQQSRRAIERLGAKLDGVLRNYTTMPDGHVRDTVCYSIIESEWPAVRKNLDFLLSRYDRVEG